MESISDERARVRAPKPASPIIGTKPRGGKRSARSHR